MMQYDPRRGRTDINHEPAEFGFHACRHPDFLCASAVRAIRAIN
jgi:hypothetical protein